MDKSQILSGIGHAVVITWVVLGDWLFAPRELPPPDSIQVSMVSESDLKALQDAAAKSEKPPADKPEVKPTKAPPPKPQVEAPAPVEPEVAVAEPTPVEPAQPSPDIPVASDPQPIEAPPVVAPIAEEEQPVAVPTVDKKPKPRPADNISNESVVNPDPTLAVAETVTPEVTDEPTDQQVIEKPQSATAPQDSETVIVPEADPTEAPTLAPTASVRPQTRPDKPVVETPTEDPQVAIDAQAEKDAKAKEAEQAKADKAAAKKAEEIADAQAKADAEAADQAAIDAALADAASDAPANDGGQTDIPEGPPMSAGEIDGIKSAINKCWNAGTLSSAAMRMTITVRVEMSPDGKPVSGSFELTGMTGGTQADSDALYTSARSAVSRAVKGCNGKGLALDPAKFSEWQFMNLTFDPSGMRLR
ncbi:MAG: hypothetical protein V4586_19635 [Pseudomonadota bacterium]